MTQKRTIDFQMMSFGDVFLRTLKMASRVRKTNIFNVVASGGTAQAIWQLFDVGEINQTGGFYLTQI